MANSKNTMLNATCTETLCQTLPELK